VTCLGDSGGGFSVKRNNKWYLRGVVSFGISKLVKGVVTCDEQYSTLFVDVTGYMDWIVRKVTEYQQNP
jgi:secreted trypsin-like serine protease